MDPQRFLESLIDYEKIPAYDYDLGAYQEFLSRFDAPHQHLRYVIHIAGTKGKGSTATLLESCLRASGYRTGLFTSPHLARVNERIRVNNRPIANKELADILARIKTHIKRKHRARTFFEVLTTTAFLHFIKKNIDFAILEAGLGGRLDSTNVTHPVLSIITRIGFDHMHLLGRRLRDIAGEKAGIIKRAVPVVTFHQHQSVDKIIKRKAERCGTSLRYADEMNEIVAAEYSLHGTEVVVTGRLGGFTTLLPLVGGHQLENLTVVLGALAELKRMGWGIIPSTIADGIQRVRLRGRFDIVKRNPLTIFDCAHNEDSFKNLHATMKMLRINDYVLIFGVSQGKDYRYFLRHVIPRAHRVYLVKTDNPRAVEPSVLHKQAIKYSRRIEIAPSVARALCSARRAVNNKGTIVITGSVYLWQKEWPVY